MSSVALVPNQLYEDFDYYYEGYKENAAINTIKDSGVSTLLTSQYQKNFKIINEISKNEKIIANNSKFLRNHV